MLWLRSAPARVVAPVEDETAARLLTRYGYFESARGTARGRKRGVGMSGIGPGVATFGAATAGLLAAKAISKNDKIGELPVSNIRSVTGAGGAALFFLTSGTASRIGAGLIGAWAVTSILDAASGATAIA